MGFSVETVGRNDLLYSEDGKTVQVDFEYHTGSVLMAIELDSIASWEAPHEAEQITALDRQRIVDNIRMHYASRGFEIEVF